MSLWHFWRRRRRQMTRWEKLRLSPFQKWKLFGRPPWKFLIQVMLVVLTTLQVLLWNSQVTPFQRAQRQNWQRVLPLEGLEPEDEMAAIQDYTLFTVQQVVEQVDQTLRTFWQAPNQSIDFFDFVYTDANHTVLPPRIEASIYEAGKDIFDIRTPFDNSVRQEEWTLQNKNDRGPFAAPSDIENDPAEFARVRDQLRVMRDFSVQFEVRNFLIRGNSRTCFHETVTQKFAFAVRGAITARVEVQANICESDFDQAFHKRSTFGLTIVLFLIAAFAVISEVLHWKAVLTRVGIFREVQRERAGHFSFRQLLHFINIWFVIGLLSNLVNVTGAGLAVIRLLSGADTDNDTVSLLLGLGCLFAWINLTQFFEHAESYYALIMTLKLGTPRVGRFLLGVLPIFMGYAFFGVAYFSGYSHLFADLDASSVTLFALLNGDVIHDVFDNVFPRAPTVSRLYLYSFVILFIYAVLNIFIALVEDAFFASKEQMARQKHSATLRDIDDFVGGQPPVSSDEEEDDDDVDDVYGDDDDNDDDERRLRQVEAGSLQQTDRLLTRHVLTEADSFPLDDFTS